jgi:hypothetical protein
MLVSLSLALTANRKGHVIWSTVTELASCFVPCQTLVTQDRQIGHVYILLDFHLYFHPCQPITVASRSKTWTVFARSKAGIVGSNPTQSMDVCIVCVYSVFVLFCMQVEALRRADPPSKEFHRICIRLRNWKRGNDPTKGCRAIIIIIILLCHFSSWKYII